MREILGRPQQTEEIIGRESRKRNGRRYSMVDRRQQVRILEEEIPTEPSETIPRIRSWSSRRDSVTFFGGSPSHPRSLSHTLAVI